MKATHFCLILITLVGTCHGAEKTETLGPFEFKKTDGHLWLHLHRLEDDAKDQVWPIQLQLAGVSTKFVPLVYFKGNKEERKRQREANDEIAAFIAKRLKGKKVWIEDTQPQVFAGPGQVLGIVWLDPNRKRSLQQLLVKKGLAVKKSNK